MLISAFFVEISNFMENKNLIPTEKILERLRFENPWWNNKQTSEVYASMSKRLYEPTLGGKMEERKVRLIWFWCMTKSSSQSGTWKSNGATGITKNRINSRA